MADVLDWIDIDDAKRAVGLSASRAGQEEALEGWVTAISRRGDTLYGPVVRREVTETVTPVGQIVLLSSWPVDSVTSVTEYISGTGTVLTAESTTVAGDYLLDADIGKLTRRSSWTSESWGGRATVVYQAGRYATTAAVSEEFKQAARGVLVGMVAKYAGNWARGG